MELFLESARRPFLSMGRVRSPIFSDRPAQRAEGVVLLRLQDKERVALQQQRRERG